MKFKVRHEVLAWFDGGDHLKLLHLSDFHIKWSRRRLDAIEGLIALVKPDVIALTGDYFDTATGAKLFADFLQRVAGVYPVYWVSGNHDRWYGDGVLNRLHQVANAICVDDQPAIWRTKGGATVHFCSWQWHLDTPTQAGERRIVLLHNPEEIEADRLAGCDLLLAGHLHGGQFVFWRNALSDLFPGRLLYRWCCERRDLAETTVIVSKGLGDTLPLRIGCQHELVVVQMQ